MWRSVAKGALEVGRKARTQPPLTPVAGASALSGPDGMMAA
jgi:hypothetical protein